MRLPETNEDDAAALALNALSWILADDDRRDRFLALTGTTPDGVRSRLADPAFLEAVIGFLCGHEPDLLSCAEYIGVAPGQLVAARERLL